MRILVVDDDYVSRTKLKTLLSIYGDCDTAPNGEIAVSLFEESKKSGIGYDLVTMDINMPGISGHDAIKKILEIDVDVKILMITVESAFKTVASAYKEGCGWYLTKPINQDNLQKALEQLNIYSEC